jgi:hypothetical protein
MEKKIKNTFKVDVTTYDGYLMRHFMYDGIDEFEDNIKFDSPFKVRVGYKSLFFGKILKVSFYTYNVFSDRNERQDLYFIKGTKKYKEIVKDIDVPYKHDHHLYEKYCETKRLFWGLLRMNKGIIYGTSTSKDNKK